MFISEDPPHGATVIVFRRDTAGEIVFLILHRARRADADGAWEWGPPAGVRLPGESVEACAQRELDDQTGLHLELHQVPLDPAWASYWAEAPADVTVSLARDHDAVEWVPLADAVARCRPAIVAEQFQALAAASAA